MDSALFVVICKEEELLSLLFFWFQGV
jgi:hypothetical protein